MKVRRLVVAFTALIAGPAIWAAAVEPAHAGGPTSVLLSNPGDGRVGALYHTSADYNRLAKVVGAFESTTGETDRPAAVRDGMSAYRLTWMIHDMTVWRIDLLYETADGVWIETMTVHNGSDPFAGTSQWTLTRDKAGLNAVFRSAGILGDSPEVASSAADTPAAGPGAGAIAAGAGLAGLAIGAGGALLLRRPRAVLTG